MSGLIRTNSGNSDFRELVAMLDAELAIRDGAEHSFYAQFNKIDSIANVVVAYDGDRAIGCGAFKPFEGAIVEIKRMYVRPEYRGRAVAVKVLDELEKWAREEGAVEAVLETGFKQPEAIRLYEKSGYDRIPNYGQYADVENSICMRKSF
ncbi:MAG: GNAT family N-acetyltransferase [Acidobacteria bacterium]|nr:GNAT family N-acetyltransferase [Acidobacteriota bacterium]MBK8148076.1 GNAT family N-acetyltransferase [Acidobacteriota bacterium]